MRIALGVEYFGGAYCGWQKQLVGDTVQSKLEAAIARIAGHTVSVCCAGRTDAGVHATWQVVHFDTDVERPLSAWVRGVNTFLPEDVAVTWAEPVQQDFHARFCATGRRYRYLLLNRGSRAGVWHGRAGWYHHPLDERVMHEAAQHLVGEHDFSVFRAAECQAKSPVKLLREATVFRQSDLIIFEFEASAFLHHMVRNMVGSLVYIGQGKHAPEWIPELLSLRNRAAAAPTFSPHGLYLVGVQYDSAWGLPVPQTPVLL